MSWLILAVSIVLSCELFCRSSLIPKVSVIGKDFKKIFNVIRSSKISDHWKEIILPHYSLKLGAASVRIFVALVIVVSPFLIFLIIDHYLGFNFYKLLVDVQVVVMSTIVAVVYMYVRNK